MMLMSSIDGHLEGSEIATLEAFINTLPEFKDADFDAQMAAAKKLRAKFQNAQDAVKALADIGSEAVRKKAFVLAAERAMIGWIDALAGATGAIPDDVWAEARAHWAEHELVEVAVTVGATMFLNRFATGLQLPTSPQVLERLTAEGLS